MNFLKSTRLLLLCLICFIAIIIPATNAESKTNTFSTRSFTNTAVGSDPHTLTYQHNIIRVNLANIRNARVTRATLDPYVVPEPSTKRYEIVSEQGQPLTLMPPRYLTFDATKAVQTALASGKSELVLRVVQEGQGFGKTISLNVWSDAPAPKPIQQVTQIKATHRQGDTLLSFRETTTPPVWGSQWTVGGHQAALAQQAHDQPRKLRYRIYRSTTPFTHSGVVASAELVDEIMPYSGWNINFNGHEPKKGLFKNKTIPMLPIADNQLAPVGTGIYVHRHEGRQQTAYYLVSTVVNGAEDFSSLSHANNVSNSVFERQGNGMTLQWQSRDFSNNHWSSSAFVNARFDYFVRWEKSPQPSQPYNYRLAFPTGEEVSDRPPLTIALHAWSKNLDSWGTWHWPNFEEGAILLTVNNLDYTAASAVHEFQGTLKPWQDGTAQPFFQARTLSFVYDYLMSQHSLNTEKFILFGESMGATSAHLWGIRSGHIFSQIHARVGHHIPASDIKWRWQFEEHGYGLLEWDVKYSNQQLARFGYPQIRANMGVSVWDYFDSNQWLRANPHTEIPYITHANSPSDYAIGWEEVWLVTQAMIDTKRAFDFTWTNYGHSSPLQEALVEVNRSQSLPAFTNGSLDKSLGTTPEAAAWSKGKINRYQSWSPDSIVDTPNRWSVSLYLTEDAPRNYGSVDVTPRRLQQFRVQNGRNYRWSITDANGSIIQSGTVTAFNNLITIPRIALSKHPVTLTVTQ